MVLVIWFLSSFSSGLDFDSLLSFGLRAELVMSGRVSSHFLLYTGFSYRDLEGMGSQVAVAWMAFQHGFWDFTWHFGLGVWDRFWNGLFGRLFALS